MVAQPLAAAGRSFKGLQRVDLIRCPISWPVPTGSEYLAQVTPADLDISILGQMAPAQLLLGDTLEPGPLKVIAAYSPVAGPVVSQIQAERSLVA